MNSRDGLGSRGEALFIVLMTKFHPKGGPIFAAQFLGEKSPLVDFLVVLLDAGAVKPFFFVQVKTTRAGYTIKERRLRVKVKQEHVAGLALYPAPTYIVGIDDKTEEGFVISANGVNLTSLSSITTAYPLDEANRQMLWDEVRTYWTAPASPKLNSAFHDTGWK